MPNWVANRLIVTGENAEEILSKHVVKIDGEEVFDFNLIDKQPEELNIEKGSRGNHGLRLYIAKINPLIANIGTKEDKLDLDKFSEKMITLFGSDAIKRIPDLLLRPNEVDEYRCHYKDKFDEVVNIGEQAFNNISKYGVADWYDWRWEHWGTKWNACNTYLDGNLVCFDTAWGPPVAVIEKFAKKYPQLSIVHEYAEEQIAFFCGRHEYTNSEVTLRNDYPEFSKEAYELYFDMWGCEEDFVFDPKKNTYVEKEDVVAS